MFDCGEFNAGTFTATSKEWDQQLQALIGSLPVAHHKGILAWVEKHLVQDRADPNTYAYALMRKGQPYACAVLEVSYAKIPGDSWLKVLQVHTEPKLDASIAAGDEVITELSAIAAYSLVSVLGLTYQQYPCNRLKVYGRTPLTVEFLEGVAGNLTQLEGLKLKIYAQAGWLIFDK